MEQEEAAAAVASASPGVGGSGGRFSMTAPVLCGTSFRGRRGVTRPCRWPPMRVPLSASCSQSLASGRTSNPTNTGAGAASLLSSLSVDLFTGEQISPLKLVMQIDVFRPIFCLKYLLLHKYLPNPLARDRPKTNTNLPMPFLDYAVFPGQIIIFEYYRCHFLEYFGPHCYDCAQI